LFGGVLGAVLAHWGIQIFRALVGDFPSSQSISIDARVLLFTLGTSLSTAFIFGLIPALQASNPNLNNALRGSERRTAGSRGLTRHALAVSEVALAMVLLIGAGLMINSILRLQRVNPGFDSSNLLTISIQLPEGGQYMNRVPGGDMERAMPAVNAFYKQLLERAAALPGVESVGSITGLPTRFSEGYTFSILGHPEPPPDQRPRAGYNEISPGFFRTFRIPLKKGRYLDDHDTEAAPWAVVVNETFAHKMWGDASAIGQRFIVRGRLTEVVGMVEDGKYHNMQELPQPLAYLSLSQNEQNQMIFVARSQRAQNEMAATLERTLNDLEPDARIKVHSWLEVLGGVNALFPARAATMALCVMGLLAAMLAVTGIFGMAAYNVSRRMKELGIRVALGARTKHVISTAVGRPIILLGVGSLLGLLLGVFAKRLLEHVVYQANPLDPMVVLGAVLTMVLLGIAASAIPALRALAVDPSKLLREE